jgi:hypothetical protein
MPGNSFIFRAIRSLRRCSVFRRPRSSARNCGAALASYALDFCAAVVDGEPVRRLARSTRRERDTPDFVALAESCLSDRYSSESSAARCARNREARSSAKRFTPAKTELGSRCASAMTSASSPPVSHWLSQSAVSE